MPCPMIGTLQWLQRGASMWIAHANESNVCVVPPIFTSNALSYVLPQVSQGFIPAGGCKVRARRSAEAERDLLFQPT